MATFLGKGQQRVSQSLEDTRTKRKSEASRSIVRALVRRRALGKKGSLPSRHGLPKTPASLVYSMSDAVPMGQRHNRVVLGFTADGEHMVVSCGPLGYPSWLELRRVRLQWRGLSRPGEAVWAMPLNFSHSGHPVWRGNPGSGDSDDEEDGEGGDEELDGLQMGVGGREASSVAVTESADGFLIVAVVFQRYTAEAHDADRIYSVYIAPGPSYVAATNASPEFPFSGLAFSYIVPGGSGCPIPSVAAHDVAAVDDGDETRWHRGKPGERKYVLVLNAVDAIHVLEVMLHAGENRAPADPVTTSFPFPSTAKFIVRPRKLPSPERRDRSTLEANLAVRGGPPLSTWPEEVNDSDENGASTDPPSSAWWALGRGLPSVSLIFTQPLPCRRPVSGTGRERSPSAGSARTSGTGSPPFSASGSSSEGVLEEGAGGQGTTGVRGTAACLSARRRRARASVDDSRQGVLDLEAFISQLLRWKEAYPSARQGIFDGVTHDGDSSQGVHVTAEGVTGDQSDEGVERGSNTEPVGGGDKGESSPADNASYGGCPEASSWPSALAMDYHCVTVGVLDRGRQALLCLVIKVVYRNSTPTNAPGDSGTASDAGRGAGTTEPELLGYLLALDLRSGEVAVLETRASQGGSNRCAPLCDSLARSVRRRGKYPLEIPGRRLSNTAVMQGRSLKAIINPVFPVAIVMPEECR